MVDRIGCCIPFCRRTCKPPDDASETVQWICGKHWMMVPKHMRIRDRRLLRRYIKLFGRAQSWVLPAGSEKRTQAVRLTRLIEMSWVACKKKAIERAGGI